VTLTAATAGLLDGPVAVGLTSNANGLAGLTNVGLAGQSVAVTGAAYDFAQPPSRPPSPSAMSAPAAPAALP